MSQAQWPDSAARHAIASELDVSMIVEAAAGTGKTTALVQRIVALLASGRARIESLVCVTFTEKAAGEMKLRLRAALDRARTQEQGERRERLTAALADLELSLLGTLHGLCADLLRRFPLQAEVDPRFVVLDEGDALRCYELAFHDFWNEQLRQPGPGVIRVLRRKSRDAQGRATPREVLFDAGRRLLDERDLDAPWQRPQFAREASVDALMQKSVQLAEMHKLAAFPEDVLAQGVAIAARVVFDVLRREQLEGARDYDAIEQAFRSALRGRDARFWGYRGFKPMFGGGLRKDDVLRLRDEVRDGWKAHLELADGELAALLREDLRPLVSAYERELQARGALDFAELLLATRRLLRERGEVRAALREQVSHVMVDEFQDTDPVQWEIVRALTYDEGADAPMAGRLFLVGDPKQSIYRFRRADMRLYERIKRELTEAAPGAEGAAKLVQLTTNFRSAASIIELCNQAFAPLMRGDASGAQAHYVAMHAAREDEASMPALVALPVPRPYSQHTGKTSPWAIETSYPDAVGGYVQWLLEHSGWTVQEGRGRVPLASRHICLLFRRFSAFGEDMTRPYVQALASRKVPHVLVGGRSFYEREEVQATRALLSAIEWPDDELLVYAALRGPFLALADDVLLAYRTTHGPLHPLRPVPGAPPPRLAPVQEALRLLRSMHIARNERPLSATVHELLRAVRAQAGVLMWPGGEQALANLARLAELARREDARGQTTFRALVQRLAHEAERGSGGEVPAVEEGADGVRLMTVHKAKGLEFPVVILVDPTAPEKPERPSRYVDPARGVSLQPLAGCAPIELSREHAAQVLADEQAENARLAYVAATRARDLLVVPVHGDEALGGWLAGLMPALMPARASWREPTTHPGVPAFGDDSVLERPDKCMGRGHSSVQPGVHRPQRGAHSVVFWDPALLQLGTGEESGVRQQQLLAQEPSLDGHQAGQAQRALWTERRQQLLASGVSGGAAVRSATEQRALAQPIAGVEVSSEQLPRAERKVHGPRFGTLLHALLEEAARQPAGAQLAASAEQLARALGATDDERTAAQLACDAVRASDLWQRAERAERWLRETPLSVQLADGTVVHGVLDAAFFEPAHGWTVIDFKSDEPAAPGSGPHEHYAAQLSLYVQALAQATGQPARGVLFYV